MDKTFISKTNHVFCQIVFIVAAVLAAIVFVFLEAYRLLSLYFAVLIHRVKDACGCESMSQFFAMHPDIFKAVILFGAGIGIFIIYSLYKLIRLNFVTKKYVAHYLSSVSRIHSVKLRSVIKKLNIEKTRVIEINSSDLAVFCFGYWRPKICISRALVDLLDNDELIAVLMHEVRHMVSYEPIKIFIVKYFRSIFFFLPGLKIFAKKYFILSELAADEKASGDARTRSGLAGAILKISEKEEISRLESGSSFFFSGSTIEERVNRLSDESYTPKFKFIDRSLIAGSLGLAVVSLVFIFIFSTSIKAFEMHDIVSCISSAAVSQKDGEVCSSKIRQDLFGSDKSNSHNIGGNNFGQNFTCIAE